MVVEPTKKMVNPQAFLLFGNYVGIIIQLKQPQGIGVDVGGFRRLNLVKGCIKAYLNMRIKMNK